MSHTHIHTTHAVYEDERNGLDWPGLASSDQGTYGVTGIRISKQGYG